MSTVIKVPFVGDGGVGKTSFVNRYVGGKFAQDYKMTIGVEFHIKEEELPDGTRVKVQLWDTGGQQRFTSIRSMYYKGSSGFVFIYDVTRRPTFENLKFWFEEIYKHEPNSKIIIIGNKIDLMDERTVSSGEGRNYALSIGALHAETSAKTGTGVTDAMKNLLQSIIAEKGIQVKVQEKVSDKISKLKQTVHPHLLNDDEIVLYELKTK